MEMNKENNTPFKAEDVNWDELAAIGILKDELEMAGELDTLLSGEKTNVVSLSLVPVSYTHLTLPTICSV